MSSVRGRRPTATRSSSPRSSSPPSSRSVTCPPSPRAAAVARGPGPDLDPGRARARRRPARWRTAPRRRGCGRPPRPVSTLEPRLLHACAISTPTTPPPRISSRSGTALGRGRLAVRPRPRLGEPLDRRHRGGGAGGDDDRAAGAHVSAPTVSARSPSKVAAPADQLDPAAPSHGSWLESSRSWITSSRRRSTISGSSSPADQLARARHPLDLGQQLARAQQRLRRHAGVVGALAADQLLLDQGDLEAAARRAARRRPRPPGPAPITIASNSRSLIAPPVSADPAAITDRWRSGQRRRPRAARDLPRQALVRAHARAQRRARGATRGGRHRVRDPGAPRPPAALGPAARARRRARSPGRCPRGVPEDPSENRLAVHTEDHPLEYLDFHGEIPKGEYGAGAMTIWDRGTYEAEKFEEKSSWSASTASGSAAATRCFRPAARTG